MHAQRVPDGIKSRAELFGYVALHFLCDVDDHHHIVMVSYYGRTRLRIDPYNRRYRRTAVSKVSRSSPARNPTMSRRYWVSIDRI
jgi:hypothetical protein